MSGLVKRSFSVARHRTSVALEPAFWAVLERLAAGQGQTLAGLVTAADARRDQAGGLASTLRVLALEAAGEKGAGRATEFGR